MKYLLIELILFILILYAAFFFYHQYKSQIQEAEEVKRLQLAPFIFNRNLKDIGEDLLLLAEEKMIRASRGEFDTGNLELLRERLRFWGKLRRFYNQIRYINRQGMEIIRVNRKKGRIWHVVTTELQDKSDRYYFKQIKKLEPNEIYISHLDLNIEEGKIVIPLEPTIRFGIPVFTSENRFNGMIIVNYNADYILNELKENFVSTDDKTYALIGFNGKYIRSFCGKKDWDKSESFKNDYPAIWQKLQISNSFQIKKKGGIFTILAFHPYRQLYRSLSKSSGDLNITGPGMEPIQQQFTFVSLDRQGSRFQLSRYLTHNTLLIIVLVQLILVIFLWRGIQKRVSKTFFSAWMESFFQGIENNPVSIILTDRNGSIQYVNKKFTDLSGYSFAEVSGKNPRMIKSGEMSDLAYAELWKTISSGKTWKGEFHNKSKKGELYWVMSSISPIMNRQGKIIRYLGVQEDISLRKKLIKRLEQKASTDYLTGLLNRRSFLERMEVEVKRAQRNDQTFTLLMIDIDDFKQINDSHGHKIGDSVLIHLSSMILDTFRATDLCCRFGGEEFLIALNGTEIEAGISLAERLLRSIRQSKINIGTPFISYTLSIGVTEWQSDESVDMTISRADEFLYKAKQDGKNRVCSSITPK